MAREPVSLPDPDRVPDAPHPRAAPRVVGQEAAVAAFVEALDAGRLHHAWLLAGPRGVGKATFAWAAARRLLAAQGGPGLAVPEGDPVHALIRSGAHPGLARVVRTPNDKGDKLSEQILVDDIRKLGGFFHLTAIDGGRRVVILDAADEMNAQAANALLKLLEEPPARATFLLVAHRPGRLLPTIRSRCRLLRFAPLAPEAMAEVLAQVGAAGDAAALTALAAGSAGEACRLAGQDGLAVYARLVEWFGGGFDRGGAIALADGAGRRAGAEGGDPFDLTLGLIETALARLARTGLHGPPLPQAAPGEGAILSRLSPDAAAARAWAEAQATLPARARAGRAVNLDPSSLVLDTLLRLADVAAGGAKGRP